MAYQTSLSASCEVETAAQGVNNLENVVVYICPNGYAQLKKEEKPAPGFTPKRPQSAPKRTAQAPVNRPPAAAGGATTAQPARVPRSTHVSKRPAMPASKPAVKPDATTIADLGERLVKQGLLTRTQLEVAKYDMSCSGMDLAEVLVARNWLTAEAIAALS